jgi:Fusaric acid resistance protein family
MPATSSIAPSAADPVLKRGSPLDARRLDSVLRAAGPPLLFGLRLWASVCLALYVAFWLQLDDPFWAGTSAAIVCQPQLGASLRKGWFRMIGTLIGAMMSVLLTACFPQDRVLFLGSLALWGATCAIGATLLRNFASYAAALAGYTAAIVAGDLLGLTGGVDADAGFLLAVSPGERNLPRHRLCGRPPCTHRFRRRAPPARRAYRCRVVRRCRRVHRHVGISRRKLRGDAAGATRAAA